MEKTLQTACFTGHRIIPTNQKSAVLQRSECYIRSVVEKGVRFFGVGGAIGYDTEMSRLLFRLRNTEFPHIKVILVYPFDGFTSRWSSAQQEVYNELLSHYDKIVRVCDEPSREAYLVRNRHLVNSSAFCISYCTRNYGGTAYTVRYAQQNNLTVWNTADFDIGVLKF